MREEASWTRAIVEDVVVVWVGRCKESCNQSEPWGQFASQWTGVAWTYYLLPCTCDIQTVAGQDLRQPACKLEHNLQAAESKPSSNKLNRWVQKSFQGIEPGVEVKPGLYVARFKAEI